MGQNSRWARGFVVDKHGMFTYGNIKVKNYSSARYMRFNPDSSWRYYVLAEQAKAFGYNDSILYVSRIKGSYHYFEKVPVEQVDSYKKRFRDNILGTDTLKSTKSSVDYYLPNREKYPENDLVKFTPDFLFKSGIYLTFENFKYNSPISPDSILQLRAGRYLQPMSLKHLLSHYEKFEYVSDHGDTVQVYRKDIWGYSDGIGAFIQFDPGWFRSFGKEGVIFFEKQFEQIAVIGQICAFHLRETPDLNFNNPIWRAIYTNDKPYMYANSYLFLMESGDLYEMRNFPIVDFIKKNDYSLYEQLADIKRSKGWQFLYIRKYNERHPVYFPR